jgi:ribosomal protein L11 methyltransferase
MANSSIKRTLTKVSISIHAEAEDAVSALMETIFGQTPSIYTDARTGRTQASLYLDEPPGATQRNKLSLALRNLKSDRVDVGPGRITVASVPREDWAESWKKHFKPIAVGDALLIKPSWSKLRPKKGQAVVVIDPGLSFGTGQHATTSFCLHQLVACRAPKTKQAFLDIGTGSGILAIAAAKLGYDTIDAFDFDPESIRVARENASHNDAADEVHLSRKDLTKMPQQSARRYDVICANLIYDLLIQEADRICNRLKPQGQLVLAGILKTQFSRVRKAYESRGFKLRASKVEREWQSGRFSIGK